MAILNDKSLKELLEESRRWRFDPNNPLHQALDRAFRKGIGMNTTPEYKKLRAAAILRGAWHGTKIRLGRREKEILQPVIAATDDRSLGQDNVRCGPGLTFLGATIEWVDVESLVEVVEPAVVSVEHWKEHKHDFGEGDSGKLRFEDLESLVAVTMQNVAPKSAREVDINPDHWRIGPIGEPVSWDYIAAIARLRAALKAWLSIEFRADENGARMSISDKDFARVYRQTETALVFEVPADAEAIRNAPDGLLEVNVSPSGTSTLAKASDGRVVVVNSAPDVDASGSTAPEPTDAVFEDSKNVPDNMGTKHWVAGASWHVATPGDVRNALQAARDRLAENKEADTKSEYERVRQPILDSTKCPLCSRLNLYTAAVSKTEDELTVVCECGATLVLDDRPTDKLNPARVVEQSTSPREDRQLPLQVGEVTKRNDGTVILWDGVGWVNRDHLRCPCCNSDMRTFRVHNSAPLIECCCGVWATTGVLKGSDRAVTLHPKETNPLRTPAVPKPETWRDKPPAWMG
jgi:hypothetical protein